MLFIPKVGQSVALLVVEILIFASFKGLKGPKFNFSDSSQNLIIKVIFYSNFLEYGFMLMHIFMMISLVLTERKKKQQDPDYKKWTEKRE